MQQHFVQMLAHEYYLDQKKQGASDEQALQLIDRIKPFLEYCRAYLINNRPAALGHAPSNYSVTLTNGQTALVCPDIDQVKGTMQPSGAVHVSHGQGAYGTGMIDTSYAAIGHQPHVAPPTVNPMLEAVRDLSQSSGPIDFTKPGAQIPRY